MSWLILGESSSKERFAVVDAVPTPTPTPLLDAIRARAEICVLRTTLSAEMACGVCAANVRCLELERVCMRIDLVLSSSIDHTVSFYDDSDVLTPSLFSVAPVTRTSTRRRLECRGGLSMGSEQKLAVSAAKEP